MCAYINNSFERVDGILNENGAFSVAYDELEPNEKVSFNITVRPKLTGTYESTRARVKYSSGVSYSDEPDDYDFHKGYSTSLGRIKIISVEEFKRRYSYPIWEWIIFIVAYSFVSLVPFVIWWNTKTKNLEIMSKRKLKVV